MCGAHADRSSIEANRAADALLRFGREVPGASYGARPGGYALILRAGGDIALVSTPQGLFLPGGGQQPGELPEDAAVRETHEECGLRVALGIFIGIADELVCDEEEATHYRKRCSFFLAEITGKTVAGEPGHELVWLSPQDEVAQLRHDSQR
jgi:8-oxo-dGTP pyrophosphatase MutT (NUDIX family)